MYMLNFKYSIYIHTHYTCIHSLNLGEGSGTYTVHIYTHNMYMYTYFR